MANALKVEVTDFASGTKTDRNTYRPHKEVTLKNLPDVIDRLSVTVDNGRLAVYINGELAFYDASLTDASVDIFR